jgi:hypothetical protein
MGTNAIISRRSSVATYFDTLVAIVKTGYQHKRYRTSNQKKYLQLMPERTTSDILRTARSGRAFYA